MSNNRRQSDLPPGETIMRELVAEAAKEQPGERRGVVWRRVGFTDEALRRWVMRFSEQDLGKTDPETLARYREELRCWIDLSAKPAADRGRLYSRCPSPSAHTGTAIDEQMALEANNWFRQLLGKATHPESRTRVTPHIAYTIDVVRQPHGRGWALLFETEGSDIDLFRLYASSALASYRTGLKLCKRCSRIFLPHGRQAYCSKRCSNSERKARWRKGERARAKD
jgi:hypothetical protein